jgi:hypothetical protein
MNCTLVKKSQAKKLETSRMMLLPVVSFVTSNPDLLMDLVALLFISQNSFLCRGPIRVRANRRCGALRGKLCTSIGVNQQLRR